MLVAAMTREMGDAARAPRLRCRGRGRPPSRRSRAWTALRGPSSRRDSRPRRLIDNLLLPNPPARVEGCRRSAGGPRWTVPARIHSRGGPMLLTADVGNTETVLGVFDGPELDAHLAPVLAAERSADEIALVFAGLLEHRGFRSRSSQASASRRSSGRHPAAPRDGCSLPPLRAAGGRSRNEAGVSVLTDNPREVGADRIVNTLPRTRGSAARRSSWTSARERTSTSSPSTASSSAGSSRPVCRSLPRRWSGAPRGSPASRWSPRHPYSARTRSRRSKSGSCSARRARSTGSSTGSGITRRCHHDRDRRAGDGGHPALPHDRPRAVLTLRGSATGPREERG